MELFFLSKENAKVMVSSGGFLNLEVDGKLYENVKLVRTFPFTEADAYISVRECDEEEREIGIIEQLERDFEAADREILQQQLAVRYFTPVIKKVRSIKDEGGCSYFEVETDAGPFQFAVRSNDNSFIKLTETRIIIEDLENNRFEIPDINKLSVKERKKLDIFL